jgi:hypothetical protein
VEVCGRSAGFASQFRRPIRPPGRWLATLASSPRAPRTHTPHLSHSTLTTHYSPGSVHAQGARGVLYEVSLGGGRRGGARAMGKTKRRAPSPFCLEREISVGVAFSTDAAPAGQPSPNARRHLPRCVQILVRRIGGSAGRRAPGLMVVLPPPSGPRRCGPVLPPGPDEARQALHPPSPPLRPTPPPTPHDGARRWGV